MKIIITLSIVAFFAISGAVISSALDKNQIAECSSWQEQAKEFGKEYYILRWQADQCTHHNIFINAEIK